jgi:nitric oxide reductase subunit B
MAETGKSMVISKRWFQAALLTFLIGFSVLGYLAYKIYGDSPPIPATVVDANGAELFSGAEIMAGQHIFQKYGLMQYGTIFGHGAYLGPDFTAQYLHRAGVRMVAFHQAQGLSEPEAMAAVQDDFKRNRHDSQTGRLTLTDSQVDAFEHMREFYSAYFTETVEQRGLKRPAITDPEEVRRLTAFFAWAAWVAAAERPDRNYSYTNNWPPEPLAANWPTPDALLWSVLSLIALLGGAGLLFFFIGRYDLLGWHRADPQPYDLAFRPPGEVQLTPSQRATAWYFLVVAGLFLAQGLLGGLNAHYHVEPDSFYGIPIDEWIPYNLSRMWHLQLALFFTCSAFLAMGIFLAPMIAGGEPRYQSVLAIALFGALVLVVVGSLFGEAAGIKNYITSEGPWFWLGTQGWEFLDLGRLWQILLLTGMIFWAVIIFRGLQSRLRKEHHGNMPWLFFYSAFSIPLFYAAGMVFWKDVNFTIMDFWRFWVVHLWVEDFLEVFTTIMVAYLFVLLGVVRISVATRIVYLDIILYSIGGVIGTLHHVYFNGTTAAFMAFGAFFSAMEVIPLLLLTFEAWRFMRLGAPASEGERSVLQASAKDFPHKWAVMFLVAVGFWNFLGAGVFGFLINLPIVSYYEIGTQFTANHAHGAMMGVYGMLAMGFFMFVARYFIPPDRASERAMAISFWSLNIGLLLMIFVNLVPMGILQLYDAVANGYWHAREPAFFQSDLVNLLEWLRMPGDTIFIVGGIFPIVYLAIRMFIHRNRADTSEGREAERFTKLRRA